MICGALQTLNEDAFEDVASSERPSPSGMPTGEMIAAAAQLHLAPIRESSEFGSPSDEQKFNNNLLPYHVTNNNNNNNNNYNPPSLHAQQHHMQSQSQHRLASDSSTDYNRSASSHSLHSLAGSVIGGGSGGGGGGYGNGGYNNLGIHMGNGLSNSNCSSSPGPGTGGGGITLVMSSNNLRHSLAGESPPILSNIVGAGTGVRGRHHSITDDLMVEPLTPQLRSPSATTGIPTVIVIPNANGGDNVTHHLVDDTKL